MESIPGLLELLKGSGPLGAIIAGAIVGLVLTLILIAHFKGIWADVHTASQVTGFQQQLLTLVDKLMASEEALRRRIDEMGQDRDARIEEMEDLRVQMALLRNQRRRLIDMLRKALPSGARSRSAA